MKETARAQDPAFLAMKEAAAAALKEAQADYSRDVDDLNHGFRMVFESGWRRLAWLSKQNSQIPMRVWIFIASHADPSTGCLLISQENLAEVVGADVRTVRRAIKSLEEAGALITIREAGGNVYCLNPEDVWAHLASKKDKAPFNTRVLISGKARGILEKRLKMVLEVRTGGDDAFVWKKETASEDADD